MDSTHRCRASREEDGNAEQGRERGGPATRAGPTKGRGTASHRMDSVSFAEVDLRVAATRRPCEDADWRRADGGDELSGGVEERGALCVGPAVSVAAVEGEDGCVWPVLA